MKWHWKKVPVNVQSSFREVAVAGDMHSRGQSLGLILGIIAALFIYKYLMGFGYENKWVEYTLLPAVFFGGITCYRIVYEVVTRFRP